MQNWIEVCAVERIVPVALAVTVEAGDLQLDGPPALDVKIINLTMTQTVARRIHLLGRRK